MPTAPARHRTFTTMAVLAALAVTASAAQAQTYIQPSGMTDAPRQASPTGDPVGDLLVQRGETYHRAPDGQQTAAELRTTSALNDEVAAQAVLADDQEAADNAAYDAAQKQFAADSLAADAERRRYEAEVRASEAARLQYEHDMADWQATAAACHRGDTARCRAGSMPARPSSDRIPYPDQPLPPGEPVG